MSNQQPPQTPPNPHQVPDQRLEQMAERLRALELQNSQLRGQIDVMATRTNPQAPVKPQRDPLFKPEVQDAITQLVNERLDTTLQAERARHQQQIGWLADQLDEARFNQSYGGDKYKDYIADVQRMRQDAQARNQYITREDALRMVYFEKEGKKSLPQAPPAKAAEPKYDPYLNQWIAPETGTVVPPPAQAPEFQATPPAQGWQPPAQPAPPQTGTAQPGVWNPNQGPNNYGQNFQLPPQGVNPQTSAQMAQAPVQARPLDLGSPDADLQAFEAKYGDIGL